MEQLKKIIIFESTVCCTGGNCGPNTDKSVAGFQDAAENIKKTGVAIERYSITQNLKKFIENPDVMKLIKEQQLSVLPITMLNGNVIKTGSYPTENELTGFLQDNEKSIAQVDSKAPGECCSGKDYCDISCGPQYRDSGSKGEGNSCCC
jgi:hypothetical protein